MRRAVEKIKADPEGFVVDAEKYAPKRSIVGRLFFGG